MINKNTIFYKINCPLMALNKISFILIFALILMKSMENKIPSISEIKEVNYSTNTDFNSNTNSTKNSTNTNNEFQDDNNNQKINPEFYLNFKDSFDLVEIIILFLNLAVNIVIFGSLNRVVINL
jgi:hypothetical protein